MKLLLVPKKNQILSNIDIIDGIIIGLKDFSVTYDNKLDIEEIEKLRNMTNKEIYVVINKNIFNSEIKKIEEILKKLELIKIDGIFFYDLSILSICKRCDVKVPLIWSQTHMVTNYNTCNYYYNQGVIGAVMSNEITLKEMIEIKKKSSIKVFANIIYRPIMSFTRRSLLTNYFKSIDKKLEKNELEIYEKVTNKKYLVKEEKDGTSIIYSNIINGIEPLFDMIDNGFEYGIIDETFVENEEIITTVRDIINHKYVDRKKIIDDANKLLGIDTNFFYKETIYKVK